MTSRPWRRFLPALLLLALAQGARADSTRVAVIYAAEDESVPDSFARMITSMEALPGIEVIRLELDEAQAGLFASQLLANASSQPGGPVRLAQAGGPPPIAVIYPDIGEPYRSVFTKIIEGIEARTRGKVTSYAVGSKFNSLELSNELKKQDVRVVIALGRNGLKAASGLGKDIGVVASGVVSVPDNEAQGNTVLTLAPDPALLFSRLKAISPGTRRIFVIYEPHQNGWLIRLARDAARANGLELIAQEAGDLKTAVRHYQNFFANADSRRDALWLPQDSTTVDEQVVLPLVLEESWTRNVPVFSSSVAHVKRGVLFALYPNTVELGRNLAVSALGLAAGGAPAHGALPLRDVLAAFNTRTANHLGLQASAAQQGFDLVFPEY